MTKPTPELDPTGLVANVISLFAGDTVGTVNQFVVQGKEYIARWSGIGDPSDWQVPGTAAARAVQAGQQDFDQRYGVITGIAGGEFFGYVLQERAITKMTYVGGDIVFSFDRISDGVGCIGFNRYAQVGETVFFESERGYHALDSGRITDIGLGKVDETYRPTTSVERATVAANPTITTVFFQEHGLAYNYKTGRWTRVPNFESYSLIDTYGEDKVVERIRFADSGNQLVTDFQSSESTGSAPLDATIETAERPLVPFKRSVVQGIRPFINYATGTSVTAEIGVRNDQSTSVSYTTLSAINSRTKMHNGRVEGRYHRAKFTITGGFDAAVGGEAHFDDQGEI